MNNKKALVIFIALGVIFTIIGATFAYWNWQSTNAQKTNVTFTVGANFSCSADGGGNITNTAYFVPTDCTNSTYAIQRMITTNITNNSSDTVYMDMWLTINSIGSGLTNSQNFMYALTTSSSSCSTGVITQGNFNGKVANDKIQLLDDVSTAGTYYLYVWLDAAETSSSTMNQSVSLSVGGECTNQEPATLITKIAKNAVIDNINSTYVQNTTPGIDWGKIASDTNGKGVYIRSGTENDSHPIYYYRGAVTDNNVLFGGFCWKIVRTTDTGGIKMVYNGTPTSGSCGSGTTSQSGASATIGDGYFNVYYSNSIYVGYTYDNSGTETDSTIKVYIDGWYTGTGSFSSLAGNSLSNYETYLEDTIFCNDRSSHTYSEFTSQEISSFSLSSSHTYYGSAYRLIKKLEPSVICPSSSDAYTKSNTLGNGRLDNPIGLLTSDEIRMAGEGTVYYSNSGVGYKNQTYYLYNGGYWWTMSPYGWHGANATVLDMDPDYALMGYTVSNARGVRPSVSLKPGTVLTGGDGTSASPYTVE